MPLLGFIKLTIILEATRQLTFVLNYEEAAHPLRMNCCMNQPNLS
jgi:hypothetical protein